MIGFPYQIEDQITPPDNLNPVLLCANGILGPWDRRRFRHSAPPTHGTQRFNAAPRPPSAHQTAAQRGRPEKGRFPWEPERLQCLSERGKSEERGLSARGERRAWDVVKRDIAAPRAPFDRGIHAAGVRENLPWTSRSIATGVLVQRSRGPL